MARPERFELPTAWFVGTWSESHKRLISHAFPIAHCPIKTELNRRKPLIFHIYVMFFWTHRKRLGIKTQNPTVQTLSDQIEFDWLLSPEAVIQKISKTVL